MARVPFTSRFAIGLTSIAWFVLFVFFLLGAAVLAQLPPWVIAALAATALVLAMVPFGLWRLVRRGAAGWGSYVRCALATIFVVGALAGLPVYYLSYKVEADPLILPQVTLSNGERTVVYQGMVHIGAENFYKAVIYDLETALTHGYRLYYEGVQPSTPEADKWFSDTLAGGKDLAGNYQEAASACGLHFQTDYFGLLVEDMKARPDRHLTADVTTADLKAEYERLMRTDAAFAAAMQARAAEAARAASGSSDLLSRWIDGQRKGDEGQKKLVGILCRGIFSVAMKPADDTVREPIDRVILDFRNERLARQILSDSADRIFITYGAKHLPGVLALLQKHDPRWQVGSVKWVRAIAKPEHFERHLDLTRARVR